MKRAMLAFLLLALLLTGCQSADGTKTVTIKAPSSFLLTYWDGETRWAKSCYDPEDSGAFAKALSSVRGIPLEHWSVPEDPWPIYGLIIYGSGQDFEAAYCNGVWADSNGNVLQADVDFQTLWEQPNVESETYGVQPARRELALQNGSWDARFLGTPDSAELSNLASLELTLSKDELTWTISNHADKTIIGFTGTLEVLLDGGWYRVPTLSGVHYARAALGYPVPAGGTFSGTFWQDLYGDLPSGDYRILVTWSLESAPAPVFDKQQYTASSLRVQDGVFVLPE